MLVDVIRCKNCNNPLKMGVLIYFCDSKCKEEYNKKIKKMKKNPYLMRCLYVEKKSFGKQNGEEIFAQIPCTELAELDSPYCKEHKEK